MSKNVFHINKKGIPAVCKASKGNCPLGGADTHFKSLDEAMEYVSKKEIESYGLLPGIGEDPVKTLDKMRQDIFKIKEDLAGLKRLINENQVSSAEEVEALSNLYKEMGEKSLKLKKLEDSYEVFAKKNNIVTPKAATKKDMLCMSSIKELENYIQNIVDDYNDEIIKETCEHFGVNSIDELQLFDSLQNTMDCGWLNWRARDPEINEKITKLNKKTWGYNTDKIGIRLPVRVQGTSIQSVSGNLLKKKLADKIELDFWVHLD